ncbi:MAG: Rieske 2Fe-2S domain-containing protein [Ignavibacteria bacterium]|nr:Rieske 2Fe-2S domain-containing protein [Ignavibacteria bacterium]
MDVNKKEQVTTRRDFLRYVGSFFATGLVITTVYPILTSCEKDESLPAPPPGSNVTIDLKAHPELNNIPSIKKINIQTPVSLTIIIKRISQTNFLGFSSLCPHQGVDLELPSNPDGNLHCPRHNVDFSTMETNKGVVVSNPNGVKLGNLPTYQVEFDPNKNILTIKLS